jgi:peptidoglycan/LPS O-acetylase OafA/YrhL
MSNYLGDLAKNTDNNFNLIRVIAASMVIVAHSYPLSGSLPISFFDKHVGIHLGEYAVNIFFAISGFLVTRSFLGRPYLLVFARARCLRLIPGLTGAIIFSVLIVGPIFTQISLLDYFSDSQTYEYLLNNISLRHIEYSLPGVFEETPHKGVNGSLWSLRPEAKMYMVLAAVGSLGLLFKRQGILVLSVLYLFFYGAINFFPELFESPVKTQVTQRISLYFFLGSLAYITAERIRIRLSWALVLSVLPVLFMGSQLFSLAFAISLVYWIFYLAYIPSGAIRNFNRLGDYSYGIYVYGFIVQQIVVSIVPDIGLEGMMVTAFLGTLPLAVISWHFIEKPALDYAKAVNRSKVEKHRARKDDALILAIKDKT